MAPIPEVDTIWINGELVPWADAKVHVLTHALHYGSGVFEGIRAYKTDEGAAVLRLTDHLKRIERSAKLYYMPVPYTVEQLYDATFEVLAVQQARAPATSARSCFRGYGEMGLFPLDAPVDVAHRRVALGHVPGRRGHQARRARQDEQHPVARPHGAGPRRQGHAASTSTASWPRSRCSTPATTRPSCSPSTATSPRARARTSSACATACS